MFNILINALYSDKPRAIIRELFTNALDSHVMAGTPTRPFLFQAPTRFDDTFRVRDYGTSLCHDDVMHLYTTVGRSTKQDSNKTVGKFGLGSKVPFAYTDSFTITAYLNGEVRVYNAFKDSGKPRLALLIRDKTTEENGLEVSFPVRQEDHNSFVHAAKRVLLGFDVIPTNNIGVTKTEFKVLFEGADWKMVKRDDTNGFRGAYVRQGCVLYPIDVAALKNVRASTGLEILSDEAMVLEMPIGSVDITPSRESLSYDAVTVANLLHKLDEIQSDVVEKLTSSIKDAKTYYQAVKIRNSLLTNITSYNLRNLVAKATMWKKRKIAAHVDITGNMMAVLNRRGIHLSEIESSRSRRGSARRYSLTYRSHVSFTPMKHTFIYGRSGLKYLGYRLAASMAANSNYQGAVYYLQDFVPGGKQEMILRLAMGRPADEDLEFIDLEPIPFTKPDFTRSKITVTQFHHSKFRAMDIKRLAEFDNIYYVHTHSGVPQRNGKSTDCSNVENFWQQMKRVNLITENSILIGIPASRKDIAADVPAEWDDFFAIVEKEVVAKFNAEAAAKAELALELRNEDKTALLLTVMNAVDAKRSEIEATGSCFVEAMDKLMPFFENSKLNSEYHLAMKRLITHTFSKDEIEKMIPVYDTKAWKLDFEACIKLVHTTYPMLKLLINECGYHLGYGDNVKQHVPVIVDYINSKDYHLRRGWKKDFQLKKVA
jgi:hypothetical protein